MKAIAYEVGLTFKIPEFNFRKRQKEFYDKYKFTIIGRIITEKYVDLNPRFSTWEDNMLAIFDLSKYPKFDIKTSWVFFGITKKQVIEQMKVLQEQLEKENEN